MALRLDIRPANLLEFGGAVAPLEGVQAGGKHLFERGAAGDLRKFRLASAGYLCVMGKQAGGQPAPALLYTAAQGFQIGLAGRHKGIGMCRTNRTGRCQQTGRYNNGGKP
ncbi:hypothetical protein [Roseibium denhamense]|uniref:hypothetical protein n=1 Tax=Roseibium denhamense TaxID=76305 RepID=UPI001FCA60F8|nr:hypothetical protein [Roseibium denhamense]